MNTFIKKFMLFTLCCLLSLSVKGSENSSFRFDKKTKDKLLLLYEEKDTEKSRVFLEKLYQNKTPLVEILALYKKVTWRVFYSDIISQLKNANNIINEGMSSSDENTVSNSIYVFTKFNYRFNKSTKLIHKFCSLFQTAKSPDVILNSAILWVKYGVDKNLVIDKIIKYCTNEGIYYKIDSNEIIAKINSDNLVLSLIYPTLDYYSEIEKLEDWSINNSDK